MRSGCLGGEKEKRVQVVNVVIGAEVGVLWFGCEILPLVRVSLSDDSSLPTIVIRNLRHVHGLIHLADELPLILDGSLSVKAVTGVEGRSRILRREHKSPQMLPADLLDLKKVGGLLSTSTELLEPLLKLEECVSVHPKL